MDHETRMQRLEKRMGQVEQDNAAMRTSLKNLSRQINPMQTQIQEIHRTVCQQQGFYEGKYHVQQHFWKRLGVVIALAGLALALIRWGFVIG